MTEVTLDDDESAPSPPLQPKLPKIVLPKLVAEPVARSQSGAAPPQPAAPAQPQAPDNRPRIPLDNYLTVGDKQFAPTPPSWANTDNFLILGTDKRENDPVWRTDVLMIVALDRAQRRAAMLSIPRDLYVNIPGSGQGRINTVDYLGENVLRVEGGGPALLGHVVEREFGIKTDHWFRVQMNGLADLVDAIGGVTVNLDCPLYEPILNLDTNQWEYFTLPAGDVYLDGEDANWFVRLRIRESDLGRSRRQRQLIWAIRDQARNTNLVLRIPQLWTAFSSLYETDMGLFEIMDLARIGLSYNAADIRSGGLGMTVLQNYVASNGAQVLLIPDKERALQAIEQVWNAPSVARTDSPETVECRPPPAGIPTDPLGTNNQAAPDTNGESNTETNTEP